MNFILERYNYWIVIILMMTGLYTVFSRGNLVKKMVGLNLFQTSVFILYITMGKIAGGTAPIYVGEDLEALEGGHEAEHGAEASHGAPDALAPDAATQAKIHNDLSATNDLKEAAKALKESGAQVPPEGGSLHQAPAVDHGKITNDAFMNIDKPGAGVHFETADAHGNAAAAAADAAHGTLATVYTNPVPHVLILTAIVVGVATTAVGLALAVRIREAYGTIEEDELEAIDDIAEFGHEMTGGAAS